MSQHDILAKLLIIGNSGVGKTNILLKFTANTFVMSHITTIGKILVIKVSILKVKLFLLMEKKSKCRFGILQDNKDLGQSRKLIIKGLKVSYLRMPSMTRLLSIHSNHG